MPLHSFCVVIAANLTQLVLLAFCKNTLSSDGANICAQCLPYSNLLLYSSLRLISILLLSLFSIVEQCKFVALLMAFTELLLKSYVLQLGFVSLLCRWLKEQKKLNIFVEPRVKSELLAESSYYNFVKSWLDGKLHIVSVL